MNQWIRLLVAADLVLATTNTPQADLQVPPCLDLVMTVHDVEPDLSEGTVDDSGPNQQPDMSGPAEEPPGI